MKMESFTNLKIIEEKSSSFSSILRQIHQAAQLKLATCGTIFERFAANNYALLGVSADNEKAQLKFKEKFKFPFPLLADADKSVIDAFGVWGPKKFMGRTYNGIHRVTFIIDENGIIEEVISDVKTKSHASQILKY